MGYWRDLLTKIDSMEKVTDESGDRLTKHEHTARIVVAAAAVLFVVVAVLFVRGCS